MAHGVYNKNTNNDSVRYRYNKQVRNINDKFVIRWCGQNSVVSVVSCPFRNSITTACCGLAGSVANKSATSWQLPRLLVRYGETCVMDFGHYAAIG